MSTVEAGFRIGDAVWIEPEKWRGHIFNQSEDGRLYLVSVDGQNRARWCEAESLTRRDDSR